MKLPPPSRSWGLLRPMAMLIEVILYPLFLDAQHRREFPFHIDSHAFTGVVRLKLKLCLSCFFFCLGLYVSANHFFVDSYSGDKIAFTPNSFLVPVDLVQEVELSAEISTGIFLGGLCHHIQMNMIWLYSNFYIFPVRIILSYFLEFDLKIAFYSCSQNLSMITSYPDDMILGLVYGMG